MLHANNIIMWKLCFEIWLTLLANSFCNALLQQKPNGIREVISLDGLWNFAPNNITVPPGVNQTNVNKDLHLMPVPASYNDVGTQKGLRDYAGSVTYHRDFYIPPSWLNKRIWLQFGSVCYAAKVFVNGQFVVSHSIGHLPFGAEISSAINYEVKNTVKVVVDNTLTQSTIPQGGVKILGNGMLARTYTFDFFDYSGIDRPVLLYTTSQCFVKDISINTEVDGKSGIINYLISIEGKCSNPNIRLTILNKSEHTVISSDNQPLVGCLVIPGVHLWWPYNMHENPGYLYTLKVEIIENDLIIDRYNQPFGVRTLSWNNATFKINEKPIYLKGFGRHEDSDFRGKGIDYPLMIRDHNLIRWLGANSYRTSHYPYCEESLDLADELGIMIIDEVPSVNTIGFGKELLDNHKRSFEELYQRDKNRPSVVVWSCANEPASQYTESEPYFSEVVSFMKSLDTSRPITAAIAQECEDDKIGQFMDIIAFNKYEAWYDHTADLDGISARIIEQAENWHKKYNKTVMVSEYGADTLEGLNFLPTYIWSEEYQQTTMSNYFAAFDHLRENHEWFIGEHIWNFADFKTAETYTRVGGNKKGLFTRSRQPKASAFLLRKRYWALDKKLHKVPLPSDLDFYVESNYYNQGKDEL